MKKSKRSLALLLAIVAVYSVWGGAIRVSAADHCANTPVILVQGYKALCVRGADGSVTYPIDGDGDSEVTAETVKELVPDLVKAIATNDYDAYCEKAYQSVSKIYADISPNPDGTQKPNTGIDWSWSPATVPAYHDGATYYNYKFDIRRDPLEIADDLNAYIETVKEKTGHDQVVLASRCIGTNVALAYLYKYQKPVDYAGIKRSLVIYGGLGGFTHLEHILSGTVALNDEGLFYFSKSGLSGNLSDFDGFGGTELGSILLEVIDVLRTVHGLNVTCELVNKIYDKVKDKFIARVLKDYYGTSLTHISAIVDNYEAYKNYIFQEPGDLEKYAAIIEKADYYHYNVQPLRSEILKKMDAMGKEVYFISDYGDQAAPISEESNLIGDSYTTFFRQTLGATGSKVAGTLSAAYIRTQENKGLGKYISPDRQADLSTALFPDRTWVIKNLHHTTDMPSLDAMIFTLAHTAGATVDTLEAYPQFLCRTTGDEIVSAQEKNESDTDWAEIDRSSTEGAVSFFKRAIDYILTFVKKMMYYVSGEWMRDLLLNR